MQIFNVVPSLPEELKQLGEMAYNLSFTWHPESVKLFQRVDRNLWDESRHNPVLLLGRVSQERLNELTHDEGFITQMDTVYIDYFRYMNKKEYYKSNAEAPKDYKIAYFSMEYGVADCASIYSGGMGVLSGDHLKSASDLNIPIVAVGLAYQKGYFHQYLDSQGWQRENYPENDFNNMPLRLIRDEKSKPVTVTVDLKGERVTIRVWKMQVGRITLYLLDTNMLNNSHDARLITSQLYAGDSEMRIRQEIVLGIGGVRVLKTLDIIPEVFHMNEGHSAFACLERIRMLMEDRGLSFDQAQQIVWSSSVFTTHTTVAAGIDRFDTKLVAAYFGDYVKKIGISLDYLMSLGMQNSNFCMAVLAIRMAAYINGVSALNGVVSRKLWAGVWKGIEPVDVPITSVTNGIHIPSWISAEMASLFDRYLGPRWIEDPDNEKVWERVENIPDGELWRTHERRRERLVAFARKRLHEQLTRRGAWQSDLDKAATVLNPNALTIGFARRFATYKRGNLIFRDLERLARILGNPKRPVQLIFAGKAHPHDQQGKQVIQHIVQTIRDERFRGNVVFLEDYDINMARYLVQGVDLWLNNPRRPQEASGTSGMKVIANGGLNFSTIDGWWVEGYQPGVGWAIGEGEDYEDEAYQDMVEGNAIYNTLEKQIVPIFYDRASDNMPARWIAMMKKAMKILCPFFNTHRMLIEYTSRFYEKAGKDYKKLVKDDGKLVRELVEWEEMMEQAWDDLRILEVESGKLQDVPAHSALKVKITVFLGRISQKHVTVDLYCGELDSSGEMKEREIVRTNHAKDLGNGKHLFVGEIPCSRTGKFGFKVRILPYNPSLVNSHSMNLYAWE
ncbi:MAG: alpha-glucan family phosphorylase [Candidatus Eremiobacteraeota bacterium]|nr:alpha-glucan family phosphorylase [Candidatus Eremiobacteraeota bacterium]